MIIHLFVVKGPTVPSHIFVEKVYGVSLTRFLSLDKPKCVRMNTKPKQCSGFNVCRSVELEVRDAAHQKHLVLLTFN